MSEHDQSSLYYLCKHIDETIKAGQLNRSLKLIHDCVVQIVSEPICTALVFGSANLDKLCQKVGRHCLEQHISDKEIHKQATFDYVYLVSRLQKSGGHTRVIRNFISARPEARHLIISTELAGTSDKDFLYTTLPDTIKLDIHYAPKGNYLAKLIWLQHHLLQLNMQKVYLFNHHQDAVIIAAVQPQIDLKCSFYHHVDHQFCLGSTINYDEHIDINPLIYQRCRLAGIDNMYIPLTAKDKGTREESKLFRASGFLTTCTVARFNKVEKPYFISYIDVITQLLTETQGIHIHIGTLTPWAIWRLKYCLRKNKISRERFIYIPWVADVWKTVQDLNVDLYISSFPYGAGLTLIEIMGAGVPVAIHRNVFSNFLSELHLAYSDVFSWQFTDELIQYCHSVTAKELTEHGLTGRQHYETYYNDNELASVLDERKIIIPSTVPETEQTLDTSEYAYWLSRQFSFKHYMLKYAYSVGKKINNLKAFFK